MQGTRGSLIVQDRHPGTIVLAALTTLSSGCTESRLHTEFSRIVNQAVVCLQARVERVELSLVVLETTVLP